MTARTALLALTLSACGTWVPHEAPVLIELAPDRLECERDTAKGAQRWNDAVGFELFSVVHATTEHVPAGRVRITSRKPAPDAVAQYWPREEHGEIEVGDDYCPLPTTMAHELGHVLDLDHESDTKGVMFPRAGYSDLILPRHVEYVLGLLGMLPEQQP